MSTMAQYLLTTSRVEICGRKAADYLLDAVVCSRANFASALVDKSVIIVLWDEEDLGRCLVCFILLEDSGAVRIMISVGILSWR